MKRLITLFLLTVFGMLIFTSPIYAAQWDPATGPNWVDRAYVERADVSGDDSPWSDVDETGEGRYSISLDKSFYFNFKLFFILIIPIQIDFEEDITTGNYAENSGEYISGSRNTTGQ